MNTAEARMVASTVSSPRIVPPTAGLPCPLVTEAARADKPKWWNEYVLGVVEETEQESAAHRESVPRKDSLRRMVVVLVGAAASLTLINFLRDAGSIGWLTTPMHAVGLGSAADHLEAMFTTQGNVAFNRLAWWAVVSVLGYTVIPIVSIKLLGESIRDFGAGFKWSPGAWKPYALLFGLSIPFIALASGLSGFQARYPFYPLAAGESWWPYLWAWWGLYALQFMALEFFFRGFMVFGLRLRLGIAAVFVMMVPYTMIHFTKPFAEATAAILGGTVLGFLSLRSRSVWLGAALHIAIAATMDLFALGRAGLW